jgi:hypothetical protein
MLEAPPSWRGQVALATAGKMPALQKMLIKIKKRTGVSAPH